MVLFFPIFCGVVALAMASPAVEKDPDVSDAPGIPVNPSGLGKKYEEISSVRSKRSPGDKQDGQTVGANGGYGDGSQNDDQQQKPGAYLNGLTNGGGSSNSASSTATAYTSSQGKILGKPNSGSDSTRVTKSDGSSNSAVESIIANTFSTASNQGNSVMGQSNSDAYSTQVTKSDGNRNNAGSGGVDSMANNYGQCCSGVPSLVNAIYLCCGESGISTGNPCGYNQQYAQSFQTGQKILIA